MKCIILSVIFFNILTLNAQIIVEEGVNDQGIHYVNIVPRSYTKGELERMRQRLIPSSQEVLNNPVLLFQNACLDKMEFDLGLKLNFDSSLIDASESVFKEHLGFMDYKNQNQIAFEQIWTLNASIGIYEPESLANSLLKSLIGFNIKNRPVKPKSFFCKEYPYNDKFYLIVVIE